MAMGSPFFRAQRLERYGLEWCHPEVQLAHPLDDGSAAAIHRSVPETAARLGDDAAAYRALLDPWVTSADALFSDCLRPLSFPSRPWLMARFATVAMQSAERFASQRFQTPAARALFAGNAAHAVLPLDRTLSAAVGLMLTISAHAYGWPVARGGSAAIATALAERFRSLGGVIQTDTVVRDIQQLPAARAYLFDCSPGALADIAGAVLPARYLRRLRDYRHGPSAFKVDFALAAEIPWTATACRAAGTVHVGGTLEEIAAAERAAWTERASLRPFVLVGQQSLLDSTRAPKGRHTGWAYCHVPHGSDNDMTDAIETQIERFAPGFRQTILARHVTRPSDFASYNPNYVRGDIVGGVQDLRQLFARPVSPFSPYGTPHRQVFLCSASTPPGAGVHGMCGLHAARLALRQTAGLARTRP
jgi:phytoene dehydrogenase-like protein